MTVREIALSKQLRLRCSQPACTILEVVSRLHKPDELDVPPARAGGVADGSASGDGDNNNGQSFD